MGRVSGRARGRPTWQRYAWALIAVVMAILLRWFADPRLGTEQLPYGSVLVATMLIAWFVGMRPALVVVFVGGIAANFFLDRKSTRLNSSHLGISYAVF